MKSVNWDKKQCRLINSNGIEINVGDEIVSSSGVDILEFGRAPHKPSSSGMVYTKSGATYYPHVFGLKWEEI